MALIDSLLDVIDRDPLAIEPRVLLLGQWINAGQLGAAEDTARELLRVDPMNATAQSFLDSRQRSGVEPALQPNGETTISRRPAVSSRKTEVRAPPRAGSLPRTSEQRTVMESELSEGYKALRARARFLLKESCLVQDLQQRERIATEHNNHNENLKALADGQISMVVSAPQPCSARAVARAIEADPSRAVDIACTDFADVIRWRRSLTPDISNDTLREALVKRSIVISAALPSTLAQIPSTALMHTEHEQLDRTYVNDQTMLMDPVAEIPRSNFWVSEDGYAWDMDELAQSIASNSGIMRNPLSHSLFTPSDVRSIIAHPLGRGLGLEALALEQSALSRGVRPSTITALSSLSAVLLQDEAEDQLESRRALDDFMRYIATLPEEEQRAIDALRVPAVDSHTGQQFDCSIGEAVRDGKANKICMHKTGDLIGQAARWLSQNNNANS